MYFLQQFSQQFLSGIYCLFQEGPGTPGWTPDAAAERAREAEARANEAPEEERVREMADRSQETTAEMTTRLETERARSERIARRSAAEEIANTDRYGSGNPEAILAVVPANDAERLSVEAMIRSQGGDITDEAAINAAIVLQRGERPGEVRILNEEQIQSVREGLFDQFSSENGVSPELLEQLYQFNGTRNSEFNPETFGADMAEFATQMGRLQNLVTEHGLEMPTNQAEFDTLMERFRGEDGKIHVPMTREAAEALGFVFNEDGTINLDDSTGASVFTAAPYNSGGRLMNGETGTVSYGRRNGVSGPPANYTPSPEILALLESGDIQVVPEKMHLVDQAVQQALVNQSRYEEVAAATGVPWELIAGIHYRESSFNFSTYLHNGEPLGRTTTLVPRGLLFHDWGTAARHALTQNNYQYGRPSEDDVAGQAEFAERYNGMGYNQRGLHSPYVLAGTEAYEGQGGMFVRDGEFDRNARDGRVGVLPILATLRAHQGKSTGGGSLTS